MNNKLKCEILFNDLMEYDVISIHSICKSKIFELYILIIFN